MTVKELQRALDDYELSYDIYPNFDCELIRRELEGMGCVEVDEAMDGMIGSLRVKGLDVRTDRYDGLLGETITTTIIILC
jgi:hypothetical protein